MNPSKASKSAAWVEQELQSEEADVIRDTSQPNQRLWQVGIHFATPFMPSREALHAVRHRLRRLDPDTALYNLRCVGYAPPKGRVVRALLWIVAYNRDDAARQGRAISERVHSLNSLLEEVKTEEASLVDNLAEWWVDPTDQAFLKATPRVLELLIHYHKKYPVAGVGCGRIAFRDQVKGCVYKVPIRERGVRDSNFEVRMCEQKDNGVTPVVADCQMLTVKGLPVLQMELLDTSSVDWQNLPEWVSEMEHKQVGVSQSGEVLAYDLS